MGKNWLTTKTLSAVSPGLSVKAGVIEKNNEDTSQHVNNLISQERLSYIHSTLDDTMLELVDEGNTAFSYDQNYFDLDDGKMLVGLTESVEQKGQNVIYKGEKYSKDSFKDRKVSVIVNTSDVLDSKESIRDEPYYSFYDVQNRKRYVLAKNIIKEQANTDVKEMSIMEMTSLPEHCLNNKFIASNFPGFIIPSDDFFEFLNQQFAYAATFLEKRAPILASRKEFKDISKLSFSNIDEVLSFLKRVKSPVRRESIIVCTLLKFIFLLNKYRENPIFNFWEKCQESDDFMISYIAKIFNLPSNTKIKKDSKGVFYFTKIFPEFNNAEITTTFRVKSLDSMLQKSLGSASYLGLEDFRDIFASTAYIPDEYKKYTIDLMKQFDVNLTQSEAYVKNKGFLDDANVPGGADYKYQRAKGNIKKGISSSENFSDAKQTGEHLVKFKNGGVEYNGVIGMENRFLYGTPTEDINESGLTCHPVYDYFAKHFEGEQNRAPFYTAGNLAKLFDDFFDYLSDSLKNKYPELNLWQVMKDIYEELGKANETASFPGKSSGEGSMKDFYHSKMKILLFKYFVEKFELQRMSYGNELVFVSEKNRHQLKVGGRGYKIK